MSDNRIDNKSNLIEVSTHLSGYREALVPLIDRLHGVGLLMPTDEARAQFDADVYKPPSKGLGRMWKPYASIGTRRTPGNPAGIATGEALWPRAAPECGEPVAGGVSLLTTRILPTGKGFAL